MASSSDPNNAAPYLFKIDGFDDAHFRVQSFTGREALSEHYTFEVVLTAEADDEVCRRAIGCRAVFTWTNGATPRAFYGVVAAVRLDEILARGAARYHVRFVPRLWLLRRRRCSRIFQNLSVPDIVDSVLKGAGIAARWQLAGSYPVRAFATQYEESDYRFITRVLAEAGIYFYFPEGPEVDATVPDGVVPGDTVIFADDAAWYPPVGSDDTTLTSSIAPGGPSDAPTLHFLALHDTAVDPRDKVTVFTPRTTLRPNRASFRDYDPDRPQARPSSDATSNAPFPDDGGDPGAQVGPELEVYEHHGAFLFPDWKSTANEAGLMLRQKRRRASTGRGESGCPSLGPGHRFALQGHPAASLDRSYVVTSVDHQGQVHPQHGSSLRVYENTFECTPAEVTYVPPRPKRHKKQVALTATVVGPAGEDIYVDASGQIKVQFHWDRAGGSDERSSCWIRTMQAWGGAGWGAQFIPRVGMEVVVVFEGGDPDKPIVLGCLYNGTHPPPFGLPADKTRSGFRTQSSPGGGGSNELSFDDRPGGEQIYVHAQRDLDQVVERNHTVLARGSERLRVEGSRMDIVEEDVITRVGRNAEQHVAGSSTTEVQGNRIDVVRGSRADRVWGLAATRIEGRERRSVQQRGDLQYADDLATDVKGCATTLVGRADARRSWLTHAEGTATLSSLDSTVISSDNELVLKVGKSSIRITADKIEIQSGAVTAKGAGGGLSADDDGLKLNSKKDAQILVDKKLMLKTSTGASLSMEKEVKVDGQKILLNSPEQAADPPPKPPEPPTKIELKDQDGKPIAYQRFLVTLDDGSETSGLTDKDGKQELDLKSGGKIVFPDIALDGDKSDLSSMRPYVVRQGDHLTKLAWMQGAAIEDVWGHAANEDLKKQRQNPDILFPSDVVQLPVKTSAGLAVAKGATNTYSATIPKVTLKVCFNAARFANAKFVVEGGATPATGSTDGEGNLEMSVPVHTAEVHAVFPDLGESYMLLVGHLDPTTEDSGIRARLAQLGYMLSSPRDFFGYDLPGLSDDDDDARLLAAVRAFQHDQGLPETGELDATTLAALMKAHGA